MIRRICRHPDHTHKALVITFLLCFLAITFTITASAEAQTEAYDGYRWLIWDEEDLLTDQQEEDVYWHMDPLLQYGNVMFSTVYLSSNEDYERFAEDTYYEVFGNEPGVHFQIDMGNRKLTLSASTGMNDMISSDRSSIVDNIYSLATAGDYAGCAAECFDEILIVINDGEIAHTMKHIDNAILSLILALILNFIAVFAIGRKKTVHKDPAIAMFTHPEFTNVKITKGKLRKIYSPSSSGSGGSSSSGGGGGFSGGSSSHGF